jgi:YYY domain-containing protein
LAAKRRSRAATRNPDLDWLLAPYDAAVKGLAAAWAALRTQRPAQLFALVLVLALGVRLIRPDWYSNRLFHPDERWIFDKTAELSWPGEPGRGDPAGLQYGSLPMYSVAVVKDGMVKVSQWAHGNLGAHDAAVVAGRTLTGLVDSLSVLGTFLLGSLLLGAWPALLAALLVACSPLHIQLAHFFTVDPWLTAFAVLTLAAAVQASRKRTLGWSAFSGVLFGAALACKSSGLPLALSVALAHLWPALAPGLAWRERQALLKQAGLGVAVAAGCTVAAFFAAMPWAFLDFGKFLANQTAQRDILVTGAPAGVPFVRQYWDTSPLFHLKNIAFFYLGVPAGPLALLAAVLAGAMGVWAGIKAWSMGAPARTARRALAVRKPVAARGRSAAAAAAAAPQPASASQLWEAAFVPALLLSWVLPYFAIVGFSFAKFARYMLPILPELAVLLAGALLWLRSRSVGLYRALAGLLVVGALAHGVGYGLTYLQPHPWIEASRWIYQNVPARTDDASAPGGSRQTRLLNEDWGDDLPVEVDGQVINRYDSLKGRGDQVNIVEWDSPQKLARLSRSLSQADVIVLADPRGYGTYLRLPDRFPLTYAYYDMLFHDPGRLGFKLAHESSNPVKVLGFSLPDSRTPSVPRWLWADESFTLYDRPHAFIFTRVSPLTEAEAAQRLHERISELHLSEGWMNGQGPEELQRIARGLQAPPAAAGAPVPSAPEAVNPNFGTGRGALHPLLQPVLAWWVLITVLGWLALPLALRLFPAFPAGGYALSRALGLLLFGWLAYNLAWLQPFRFAFTQDCLWLLLAVLAAGSMLALRQHRAEAARWLKANRQEILFTEAVFALAFLAFVVVRLFNPNIHDITGQGYFGGGEPLGMTYLSAVSRCSTFPAYDPWLALANSSYYYFGYVLAATLTKLSGYPPAITYNLSLALFFSLSLVSAYGLLRALVPKRWAALGGAAMVALAGSLWTLSYVAIQGTRGVNWIASLFSHGFIWDPTRFPELVNGHIFEFPYFSYLYADLHPHNMVIGFSLLLLALFLAPFLSNRGGWQSAGETPGRALLWLGVTALVLDSQYAINTWSWPVFAALGGGCFLIGPWAGKGLAAWERVKAAAWGLLGFGVALGLGRVLMFAFRHYYLQDGADRVHRVMPSEWQMSAYIPLAYFLPGLVALALLGGARLRTWGQSQAKLLGWDRLSRKGWDEKGLILGERLFDKRPAFTVLAALFLAGVAGLLGWATVQFATQGVLALALGLGLACLGFFLLGGFEAGAEAWLWILGGFTCFLVAGAEVWYVADRMNTIFKFWINGWLIMGVVYGAGFAAAFAAPAAAPSAARRPLRGRAVKAKRVKAPRLPLAKALPWAVGGGLVLALFIAALIDANLLGRGGRFIVSYGAFAGLLLGTLAVGALFGGKAWWAPAQRGLFLGLLALGLLYPLGATLQRIREASGFTDPHLDGLQFMAERQDRAGFDSRDYDHRDLTLIRWLNANADVTETVLEAPGMELYKGYSRFAIYTGLPTLLGWDYQVGQQLGERTGGILEQRKRDAAVMYGPDEAAAVALLKQYRVRWVVVGGIERKLYPGPGLDKFAHLGSVAAQDGGSVLYRFDWDKP